MCLELLKRSGMVPAVQLRTSVLCSCSSRDGSSCDWSGMLHGQHQAAKDELNPKTLGRLRHALCVPNVLLVVLLLGLRSCYNAD